MTQPVPMLDSPALTQLRQDLKLSVEAMAANLGVATSALIAIEAGEQPITASVAATASYLLIPSLLQQQGFPQFTMGDDARVDNKHGIDYVYHNWYPRFIGMVRPVEDVSADATHISIDDKESLVVVTWIDTPMQVEDARLEATLMTASKQLKAYYDDIDLNLG